MSDSFNHITESSELNNNNNNNNNNKTKVPKHTGVRKLGNT